jgi:Protein of unknown function (DUF3352)
LRTTVSARGRRGIGAAIAAAALCTGVAACGSSAPSGTEADPAGLAPASSVIYLSATVHPEGSLRENAVADLRTFSSAKEPLGQLLQAVTGAAPLGGVSFKREIEPWVGTNAGVFATTSAALSGAAEAIGGTLTSGLSPEALLHAAGAGLLKPGADAALVLDTRDLEAARSFVSKIASRQGAHQGSYRGVKYDTAAQGATEAIVGKFAVFGDQAGVKAAIDTYLGGPSLKSTSSPYAKLAARGPAGTLAAIYLNPGGGKAGALLAALPGEPRQVRLSIVPQQHALALDADLLAASGEAESQALAATVPATTLVAGLPGNAWLAAGLGESGRHAARYLALTAGVVELAAKSVLAGFGGPALQRLIAKLSAHGQAVQQLVSSWAGPAAVFAAGSSLLSIQAGLVIQANSASAARGAVTAIGSLLSGAGANVSQASVPGAESALRVTIFGLPVSVYVGAGSRKLVIGLGPESVQGALSPTSTLSGASLYSSATSAIGGIKPSVIMDFPMALALLEGLGLNENPAVSPVLGKLRSLGTLAGGVQGLGGGVLRLHMVAGLQG